ncbi:MAG: NTP transferase domain-containing protein [Candidatus Omnitrophica bacterium]|nr:NTP transferase domain-containing protein [Candidatus Omnitrophota bacterium]
MKMNLKAIVLAAGKGTRFKSSVPKVLHALAGKPALNYVLDVAEDVGSLTTYVVVGHQAGMVAEAVNGRAVIVEQKEQLGTGHAVKMCASSFKDDRSTVLVMCGDTPLLDSAIVRRLAVKHGRTKAAVTVLTCLLGDPGGYGRIVRDAQGVFSAIREHKDASEQELGIREINTGVYCFNAKELFKAIGNIKPNAKKKEYYLTDIIELFIGQGLRVETLVTDDWTANLGLNTRADLALAESILRKKILGRLMANGVTIVDPATTYVENDVSIGQDTVIYPCSYIHHDVKVGRGCSVGPFARLRPGTRLANNVSVGNFTEVSRSILGDDVNMKHFSFLGDTTVGRGANIGCGTVTANYDGKNKNKTLIGPGAFIGCDSVLVAPVKIGKGAKVGAGSVVTAGRDVPAGKLAVGIPARVIKRV